MIPCSIATYVHSFGRIGWILMVGSLITIAGVVANALGYQTIPTWLWVALGYVTAFFAPYLAFRDCHAKSDAAVRKCDELAARIAELERVRIKIDPDPVFMGPTLGWAIRVRNQSQKAAVVSAEIIAADPPFTNHWLALPVRLRVTNQPKGCSQIEAGPDSAALFDLCMIWLDRVGIWAAIDECETPRVPYVLTVRAFPSDGPADECRFRVLIESDAGPNVVRF